MCKNIPERKEPAIHTRRSFSAYLGLAAAALACAGTLFAQPQPWLDTDGQPLPFQDDDAILEFMRTAEVVNEKTIGTGINRSVRVTLEKDNVRAHAIFRDADHRERSATINGVAYRLFADSYLFECAAYELAKLIGMPNIPPAVLRTIGRRKGSAQIWIEDALDEETDAFQPPNALEWVEQTWDMYLFDNLTYNIDRNPGNILVTPDYRLWMIDHTRAFQFKHDLLNDRVVRVRRATWDKLTALSKDDLKEALGPYLTSVELDSVIERRKILSQHIDELVAAHGEDVVFY